MTGRSSDYIDCLQRAEDYFRYIIDRGQWDRFVAEKPEIEGSISGPNGDIARIVRCREHFGTTQLCFIFFKRDVFRRYGELYRSGNTFGQTVSLGALKKGKDMGALIVIVMPLGDIYWLPAGEWLDYAGRSGAIRRPAGAQDYEASIPLDMLHRLLKIL